MVYAISDIHGCYAQFIEILKIIHFSDEEDLLFVLGDVVDRGPDGIKVLERMMENDHMVPIMGNHERSNDDSILSCEEEVNCMSRIFIDTFALIKI